MSQRVSNTPAAEWQSTRIVFIAIVAFVMLFLGAAIFFVQYDGPLNFDLNKPGSLLTWVIGFFSLFILLWAKKVFNRGIAAAKNSLNPLVDKLRQYRRALVMYLAISEAGAILNIVLFILYGNFIFLAFAAVVLGFMLAMNPSRRRLVTDLEIDPLQQNELL